MPYCKNNIKKTYTGKEPSPKGFGYCASGEKEGTKMKGTDGNIWIKKNGKWVKYDGSEEIKKTLEKKIYDWWLLLAKGNIIVIYKDKSWKLISSSKKTSKAQNKEIIEKWKSFDKDDEILAVIWSAQSSDTLESFVNHIVSNTPKSITLEKIIKLKDIPVYFIKNYKKYFVKYKLMSDKDYTLKYN